MRSAACAAHIPAAPARSKTPRPGGSLSPAGCRSPISRRPTRWSLRTELALLRQPAGRPPARQKEEMGRALSCIEQSRRPLRPSASCTPTMRVASGGSPATLRPGRAAAGAAIADATRFSARSSPSTPRQPAAVGRPVHGCCSNHQNQLALTKLSDMFLAQKKAPGPAAPLGQIHRRQTKKIAFYHRIAALSDESGDVLAPGGAAAGGGCRPRQTAGHRRSSPATTSAITIFSRCVSTWTGRPGASGRCCVSNRAIRRCISRSKYLPLAADPRIWRRWRRGDRGARRDRAESGAAGAARSAARAQRNLCATAARRGNR